MDVFMINYVNIFEDTLCPTILLTIFLISLFKKLLETASLFKKGLSENPEQRRDRPAQRSQLNGFDRATPRFRVNGIGSIEFHRIV
ncbi:MAG: hypothetical protein WBH83_05850 [Methanosarcina flavescens]|uniref:hypothetical protein n=1 Tax=Methanosarcina flavescens TaxID=1715806 RepID=UPI00143556EF|nr:hypothetical protein [Methanosarcina flavescens]